MTAENVELARRGFEAVERDELESLRELLDPDVQWHGGDPSADGACHTSDEVIEFIRQARVRGAIGRLVDVIDCGERVVVILQPPAPAGAHVPRRANLTTFRDGKVVEMVAFESPEAALEAAGA